MFIRVLEGKMKLHHASISIGKPAYAKGLRRIQFLKQIIIDAFWMSA